MASSYHGNTHSEPAKMEQIITEFFAKSLHILLESRCPYVSSRHHYEQFFLSSPSPSSSSSSSSSFRPRDRWFNLALRDCPAALENIDFWRQSNLEPMIVDVILNNDDDDETIIERWVLQYESKKSNSGNLGNKRSTSTSSHALYKKSILLLRSLYLTVRLLPAYKLFRDIISSAQIRSYNLSHRVSSFVEPFTRREEADMHKFVFTPVETSCGRLCLSVLYRSSVLEVSSEPSTPISPQFIPEYVGSPMAEPLKRLSSGPVSRSSPSSSPFGRRHSWSYDFYRSSPLPSANPSPSPTYSEPQAAISKQRSHRLPPATSLPRHLHDETPTLHTKNPSYDEYWLSPAFSPSPSPSPPTCIPGTHISKVLLRCESAPVSVPTSRLSSIPLLPNNHLMPPSPPTKATQSTVSKQDSLSGLYHSSSTEEKFLYFSRDEPGKMSIIKPSYSSSASKSFSRSSSRLSFQDDYDDSEFGPFALDDDDMINPGSRPGSFHQPRHPSGPREPDGRFPVKKSQDAAVGALVRMLKKAPPLRQDVFVTTCFVQGSKFDTLRSNSVQDELSGKGGKRQSTSSSVASSGLISKTTADALEELRLYSEMKESLLKHGIKESQG